MDREVLLNQLVRRTRPVKEVLRELTQFPWDSERTYVEVRPEDVLELLRELTDGRISADLVEQWAEALEVREDVEMSEEVQEAVFRLANPALGYQLTPAEIESLKFLVSRRIPEPGP